MDAIQVEALVKRYGRHVAVEDATFAVPAGRVCALLGPNGAGKTTTLRALLGLVRPSAGSARFDGAVAGAVLDDTGFHPLRSGRDHLRVLAAAAGAADAKVDGLLDRVGLGDDGGRRAGEYSLGMRRRLALAAALLAEPRVLVLDEPANGLDPAAVRWLRELLRDHAAQGGTVLLSSHVLAEVELVADWAVVMSRGRTVAEGSLEELGARAVRVRARERERLASALTAAGATAKPHGDDGLVVDGADAATVGAIAAREQIALHELVAHGGLEELYLRVTA